MAKLAGGGRVVAELGVVARVLHGPRRPRTLRRDFFPTFSVCVLSFYSCSGTLSGPPENMRELNKCILVSCRPLKDSKI